LSKVGTHFTGTKLTYMTTIVSYNDYGGFWDFYMMHDEITILFFHNNG